MNHEQYTTETQPDAIETNGTGTDPKLYLIHTSLATAVRLLRDLDEEYHFNPNRRFTFITSELEDIFNRFLERAEEGHGYRA